VAPGAGGLIDPSRFFEVSSVLAAGAFDPEGDEPEGDPDFDFGLSCILEGVARLAERQRAEADGPSPDPTLGEG
jgi:hypothetical protein